MQVRTTDGKIKDVSLLDVTPGNFIVPKGEEHSYHCRIEVVKFNSETGERLSKPRMQVFGKKVFEITCLHNLRKQGFKVDILHDPNKWEAENAAKLEAQRQAKAQQAELEAQQAAEKDEQEKQAEKDAMRAEIRAEIMAELKASGVLAAETAKKAGRPKKAEAESTATEEQTEAKEQ